MTRLGSLLGLLAVGGCALSPPSNPGSLTGDAATVERRDGAKPVARPVSWSRDTSSPAPTMVPENLRQLQHLCGEPDDRLKSVAAWLAQRGSVGGYDNDIDQLTFALRSAGSPYVWPAAWSRISDPIETEAQLSHAFGQWLTRLEPSDLRRCGIVRVVQVDRVVVVAVASTALADLTLPLPTQARVGQWLEFEAVLRVDASQAKLVLLPPTGEPMTVPTQQAGSLVRARFAAASPGPWLIQLLASADTGPRPMLEAMLFVDVPPAQAYSEQSVPGEVRTAPHAPPTEALAQMVARMRQETRRQPLLRDSTLDNIALGHARSMRRWQRIGHDVGDGPTHQRLADSNFRARLAGENVAHAADAARAHRALWASPSHRSNLLHRGFTRWGLGVVRDDDGSLWVCQLFASEN